MQAVETVLSWKCEDFLKFRNHLSWCRKSLLEIFVWPNPLSDLEAVHFETMWEVLRGACCLLLSTKHTDAAAVSNTQLVTRGKLKHTRAIFNKLQSHDFPHTICKRPESLEKWLPPCTARELPRQCVFVHVKCTGNNHTRTAYCLLHSVSVFSPLRLAN